MASTGEVWTLGHRPALDGVRGIAILLVVACHAYLPGMQAAGPGGVTLFFTLSGFLITALLLQEHARSGSLSLRGFYLRRARRLLPALAATIAAVAVASLWIGPWFFTVRDAVAVIGYYGNWVMIDGSLGGLSGTWSLAVEEQFYLLWPLVVILCLRRGPRLVGLVAVAGTVAAVLWRGWLIASGASDLRVYYGSETHADALLIGAAVAVALHRGLLPTSSRGWGGVAVVGVVAAGFLPVQWVYTVPAFVVPPLAAAAVYWIASTDAPPRWLTWEPLTWIGRRSYGLYLWHTPVSAYMTLAHPEWVWQVRLALLLLVAVPLTVLSWRYIERPFLRGGSGQAVQPRLRSGREVAAAR